MRRRKSPASKVFLYVWCAITLFVIIGKYFNFQDDTIISPVPESVFAQTALSPTSIKNQSFKQLEQLILNDLNDMKGDFGIVIKDIDSKETFLYHEHDTYETASLYKLWIMAEVYRQIQSGILTEDQVLSQSIPSLNRAFSLSDEVAEQTTGSISLSVKNALNQMITISHNYAAMLLTAKIRLSKVTDFLKLYGFSESKVGTSEANPLTTASDIAKFLELVYNKKLINPEASQKMLSLLKEQKLYNKLPKYLPEHTVIAHKTGELGTFTHDAGIVYTPNGDYIIVILSKHGIPADAEEKIASISKSVYDFLSK